MDSRQLWSITLSIVGLNVGADGLAFKCLTVNVQNDSDEPFLSFLESDVFRTGLQLVSTAQPAIAPLSGMAVALTNSIASRNRNPAVQEFHDVFARRVAGIEQELLPDVGWRLRWWGCRSGLGPG